MLGMNVITQASRVVNAADAWTRVLGVPNGARFSITATEDASSPFVGTVTLQARPINADVPHAWSDVATFTDLSLGVARFSKQTMIGDWEIRIGVKAGEYTSGRAFLSLVCG